jgi:hypothetical protein
MLRDLQCSGGYHWHVPYIRDVVVACLTSPVTGEWTRDTYPPSLVPLDLLLRSASMHDQTHGLFRYTMLPNYRIKRLQTMQGLWLVGSL